jgi:hypothetical protein
MGARETLADDLIELSRDAAAWKSPLYAGLTRRMSEDVKQGGPTWGLLEPYAEEPISEYYPFRALAGIHHMVLADELPELAKHYPSVGGDGDPEAAWPLVREELGKLDAEVLDSLRHPLQTNETSRCGALIGGFLVTARDAGLPVRALELGASAGLNLHFDRYRYEQDGKAFGPADSPVRFVDHWLEGTPPLEAPLEVVERRGCDMAPLDPTTEHDRLALLSYIFPDQMPRYELLREAIDVARRDPIGVETAGVDEWAAAALAEPAEGKATVVFHSLVWIYLEDDVRGRVKAAIDGAAERATGGAPLGWLRYEIGPDPAVCELRLTLWPGGEDRLLGTGDVHLAPVTWLDSTG